MESDDVTAIDRLSAALGALGRPPSTASSRALLASALLGAAQAEAMAAGGESPTRDERAANWQAQLAAAEPVERLELVRWQAQRACAPLPALAAAHRTDPIPLAAAQAAEGLLALLAVMQATPGAVEAGDVERLAAQTRTLREARKVLQAAVENTDALLGLLGSVDF